jgi:hypothetical protein
MSLILQRLGEDSLGMAPRNGPGSLALSDFIEGENREEILQRAAALATSELRKCK